MCSPDFFPASLNCSEVAAILHRNLHEPRNGPFFFSFKRQRRSKYNGNKSSASNEDMITQMYQAEIKQLRALIVQRATRHAKGMSAIFNESSHR
jgi:hypothetical protein